MNTKLISATILTIGFAVTSHAQELQPLKSYPNLFNNSPKVEKPFSSQNYKLPFYDRFNGAVADTARFSHATSAGNIYIAPTDGMPILQPYTSAIDYETHRTKILKPYAVEPFGKPSNVEPMPNPIKRALVFEEQSK